MENRNLIVYALLLLARIAYIFLLVNRARVGSVQLIRCASAREGVSYMVREAFPEIYIYDGFSLTGMSFHRIKWSWGTNSND